MEVVTQKNKNTELALKLLKVCTNSSFMEKTEYLVFLGFSLARYLQEPIESYMGPLFISATKVLRISDLVKSSVSYHDYFNLYPFIYIILQEEKDIDYSGLYEEIIRITTREFHHEYIDSGYWNELPEELIPFISQLCDSQKDKSILVPFASSGSFLLQDYSSFIKAYEPNKQLWFVGILRLIFKNMDTFMFINRDPFIYNDSYVKHDLVFLNTPTGELPNDIRIDKASKIVHNYQHTDSTTFAIEYALNNIKPEGSVIAILPTSFLSRSNEFSKRLFISDYIDTIIQLPPYCYNKVVVIFKKNQDGGIRMVNGDDFYTETEDLDSYVFEYEELLDAINKCKHKYARYISKEEIIANNKILYPTWYVDDTEEDFVPMGYKTYKLGDFLKPFEKIPFIGLAEVIDARSMYREAFIYQLNTDRLAPCSCEKDHYLLNDDLIIFPDFKHWNERIMYYRHKNREDVICANKSVLPFRFDSSLIDPLFFCMECENDFIQEQIVKIKMAYEEDESLPIEPLLNVKIHLPDLDTQKDLYHLEEKNFWESKLQEKNFDFEKRIKQIHKDVNNQLKIQRHCIRDGYLGAIKDYASLLSDYIAKKNIGNDYVVPSMGYTLNMLMTDMNDRIKNMAKKVSSLTTEYEIGLGENLDLCKRIYDFKSQGNYIINHYIDEKIDTKEGAIVNFNNDCFNDMMESIIGNAVKHGFTNSTNKHIIEIKLSSDNNDKMYNLQINNNGSPLPDGMDTCRYGLRGETAGKYGNEGLGGYIVKTVVEHFKGKLEIKNKPDSTFPVRINIKLPYKNKI